VNGILSPSVIPAKAGIQDRASSTIDRDLDPDVRRDNRKAA